MKEITAVYPGTFDPITFGHLDVIERAAKIFKNVIVTVAVNSSKIPLFSLQEREDLIKNSVKSIYNVTVETFSGLLVSYVKEKNASVIIRGLRAVSDFEFELQMSLTNSKLSPDITTIFMMPNEKYTYISSSLIRELAALNADIRSFVPAYVIEKLNTKLGK
jgi:pantetheine-phosphate adenylyltransferase